MENGPSEGDIRAAKQQLVDRYLAAAAAPPPPEAPFAAASVGDARVTPGPDPTENVVGLGIGEKITGRQMTGALAIKVYVRRKLPEAEIPEADRIPRTIGGVPTDVEEVGRVHALLQSCSATRRQRQAPAPCGVSVGHVAITAGTLGALVRDSGRTDNGRRYILSNNHVLANSNAAAVGDAVLQPGPLDGGTAAHQIGSLSRFVRMKFFGPENSVDAAIAEVAPGRVLAEICSVGPVRGSTRPVRDMTVVKHGRTTGLTRGVITDVDADIRVDYDEAGIALFVNTVVVRGLPPTSPFSDGGDSGSVILDSQRHRACALLFAGSENVDVTFANPIQPVLRRLRVRLL